MVNYSNGKIYKIVSNQTDLIYVGSTTQSLSQRKATHLSSRYNTCSSREILQYEDARIILIEKYSCNDNEELKQREQYFMDKFRAEGFKLVNNNRAFGLDLQRANNRKKDYYENNKEFLKEIHKEWREDNKEKDNERKKKWSKNNQEKVKETQKEYYQKNKEKVKEKTKEYQKQNKEKLNQQKRDNYFFNHKKRVLEVYNFIQMINQY